MLGVQFFFFLMFRGSGVRFAIPSVPCGLMGCNCMREGGKKGNTPARGLGLVGLFLRVKIFYFWRIMEGWACSAGST